MPKEIIIAHNPATNDIKVFSSDAAFTKWTRENNFNSTKLHFDDKPVHMTIQRVVSETEEPLTYEIRHSTLITTKETPKEA